MGDMLYFHHILCASWSGSSISAISDHGVQPPSADAVAVGVGGHADLPSDSVEIGYGGDPAFIVDEPDPKPARLDAPALSCDIEQRIAECRVIVGVAIQVFAVRLCHRAAGFVDDFAGRKRSVAEHDQPLCEHCGPALLGRVGLACALDGKAGIVGAEPQERIADGTAPAFEAPERRGFLTRLAGDDIATQHGECGGDELGAFALEDDDRVLAVENAFPWFFLSGIE